MTHGYFMASLMAFMVSWLSEANVMSNPTVYDRVTSADTSPANGQSQGYPCARCEWGRYSTANVICLHCRRAMQHEGGEAA